MIFFLHGTHMRCIHNQIIHVFSNSLLFHSLFFYSHQYFKAETFRSLISMNVACWSFLSLPFFFAIFWPVGLSSPPSESLTSIVDDGYRPDTLTFFDPVFEALCSILVHLSTTSNNLKVEFLFSDLYSSYAFSKNLIFEPTIVTCRLYSFITSVN